MSNRPPVTVRRYWTNEMAALDARHPLPGCPATTGTGACTCADPIGIALRNARLIRDNACTCDHGPGYHDAQGCHHQITLPVLDGPNAAIHCPCTAVTARPCVCGHKAHNTRPLGGGGRTPPGCDTLGCICTRYCPASPPTPKEPAPMPGYQTVKVEPNTTTIRLLIDGRIIDCGWLPALRDMPANQVDATSFYNTEIPTYRGIAVPTQYRSSADNRDDASGTRHKLLEAWQLGIDCAIAAAQDQDDEAPF